MTVNQDTCPNHNKPDTEGGCMHTGPTKGQADRLEALRAAIEAENISQGEIAELQGLAEHIDPSDVQLLEWAGVPEHAVIRSDTDGLFWSNAQGWVSRSEADEFDVAEQRSNNLPDGGHWENADDYDRDVVLR